jgi:hypothetical protein
MGGSLNQVMTNGSFPNGNAIASPHIASHMGNLEWAPTQVFNNKYVP